MEQDKKLKKRITALYGTCIECKQPRSHYQWCQLCEKKQCKENFENWNSGDKRVDTFLRDAQLNSTRPRTYLEWIPFDKLEKINILSSTSRSAVYSAFWKDGPRKWDEENEQYKRSGIQVIIKINESSNDNDQISGILNELEIYLNCHTQEYALLVQFYGISKHPVNNDYFIVKQFYENASSLSDYISHNFNNLNWEMKLNLLLHLSEDLKALHNAGYVHRYYKHPSSILVFDDSICAIEIFLEHKALPLSNKVEIGGWFPYKAPEILVNQPYTKASDIYSFGMIMHAVGTGKIPPYDYPSHANHFKRHLTFDICFGTRPHIPNIIPKSFKNLIKRCWDSEPGLRPNINEIHNTLSNLWSSIYRYKHSTSLNLICLEFLAADNNKDSSKSKSQEAKVESNNLELSDIIDTIEKYVEFIKMDELKTQTPIGNNVSRYTLQKKVVVCKRLKNELLFSNKLIETFIHKLKLQNRPDIGSRVIQILGISLDESTKDHLIIMQYANGGNLRKYLVHNFTKLTWGDKIKLAYQITEGMKYFHDEDIVHQNLHSKNIAIHQEEAKIMFNITKDDTEISYIDPKHLEDDSYRYDKKSDIYSLGVLMWELSSGCPPFVNNINENHLRIDLINGLREKKIPNTPNEYLDLYKSCWDPKPNKRPSINQIFNKLGKISFTQTKTNFEPSEFFSTVKNNYLIRIIYINELSNIYGDTTWKKKDRPKDKDPSLVPVIYKRIKGTQLNEAFIHELKICSKLNFSRIVEILGISLDESVGECLLLMQRADGGNLRQYFKSNFPKLTWNDKIKLAYQITEGIKFLHDIDIAHQNLHPKNIVIDKKEAKIMLDIVKSTETDYWNDHEMISYIDPKILENSNSYELDKESDIYSLGVLMWELSCGYPPFNNGINVNQLRIDLINGLREEPADGTPEEYLKLYKFCWDSEPNERPSISQVFNKLEKMDKNIGPELINLIKTQKLVKFIDKSELLNIENIDAGITSKAKWKKTNDYIICKKLKNNELISNKSIESLLHELKIMYNRLDFCQRIICMLGISLDERTNEYSFVMQYTDSGNLHEYLKNHFSTLTWNDKIKLAYQITDGIKFLQEENVLHQDLHSGNILIHKGEAKIINFIIAKSTETQNVFGLLPYIDPKRLEDYFYEYNDKSDTYSLGVIMWELSSGSPPFINNDGEHHLKICLINGFREKSVDGTPKEYLKLYKECWDGNPDKRPTIDEVLIELIRLGMIMGIQSFQDEDYTAKWIKNALKSERVKFIPFVNLRNLELLNKRGSGSVLKATCTDTNGYVVCKKVNKDAFIHELQINLSLDYDKIIRCLGISQEQKTNEYLLIMEYANDGNLQNYLQNNFNKLTWYDKIKLAFQIADGLQYIHNNNIIHRNLNSKNIVIHENKAKITNFGISKTQNVAETHTADNFYVVAYIEPKCILDKNFPYNKCSDIYSFGVLMWEISSGRPPFRNHNIYTLGKAINNGDRETPISNTPNEYEKLYKSCWCQKPEKRPTIDEVIEEFQRMLSSQYRKNINPLELINFIIDCKLITFIKKDELTEMTQIHSSNFGSIYKAIWMKLNKLVICKKIRNNESINKKQIEAFLHELNMHRRLDYCPRIIHILGINFDLNAQEYLFVMEYADGGDLRKYLKENFLKLTWDDKIKLAYQITEGIKFLQKENIFHRDLHSGNIVIHQGEAKIIDLGIAKSTETETNIHSGGVILGVLMWELSSGKAPFIDDNEGEHHLRSHLIAGYREQEVADTPKEYSELYKLCWNGNPDVRPTIKDVLNKLIELGKKLDVQYFQNIKYDSDDNNTLDTRDIQDIYDDDDDDTDSQVTTNVNVSNAVIIEIIDDNKDLHIPD
ncbi:kinase-like domain-containing protein [Rhizophagus clarus]|nr:kinase-like domain-containing protein [Rhizophagus clarus]